MINEKVVHIREYQSISVCLQFWFLFKYFADRVTYGRAAVTRQDSDFYHVVFLVDWGVLEWVGFVDSVSRFLYRAIVLSFTCTRCVCKDV